MKKSLLFVFISLAAILVTQAQNSELRRGYVGLGLGPSLLIGELSENCKTGIQVNANFGYRFVKHVGISATIFTTSFTSKYNSNAIGLFGMMAGPLFSFAVPSKKVEFDIRPMIGFGNGNIDLSNQSISSKTTFIAGLDGFVRWNCWKRWGWLGGMSLYYGNPENMNLSSFGITVGANYRIK